MRKTTTSAVKPRAELQYEQAVLELPLPPPPPPRRNDESKADAERGVWSIDLF